jgi:alkylation response protein AidB-like acyl-CoA dehydrogenase
MINSDGGYLTAFLDRDVARKLYPSLDLATCALISPGGQAVVQGDSYVLSGDCSFGSGSSHADWFFLNCFVMDENGLRFPPGGGMPETRVFAVPASEVEVLDTWHSTGLRGTASHDVRVHDVVVPAEQSFSIFEGQAVDTSPLYQWRWMFFVNMVGVPLGVARGALEEAKQVAATKIVLPAMTLAQDDPTLQANLGQAEALLGSARAYVFDTVGALWDSLCQGDLPTSPQWTAYRLANTHAFHSAKQAVTLVYEALGTTGVFAKSPLDRQLRDVTTMGQHIIAQTKTYANAGRSLLGLEPGGLAF